MELVFSALLDVENQQHVEEEVCGKSSRCLSSNSPPKIVHVKEYKRYEPPNDKESERGSYSRQEMVNKIWETGSR